MMGLLTHLLEDLIRPTVDQTVDAIIAEDPEFAAAHPQLIGAVAGANGLAVTALALHAVHAAVTACLIAALLIATMLAW